ncbi:hypothetical protein NN561_018412 [Cricetulus griseus]
MQWGVLRARASRPPQQPPGLAGSRMLRPPGAPLAVPRCPHRPHGGRLSQPEALQQGSTGAEERWRGRVSPPARGKVGGGMRSAVLTAPLSTLGARPERELELGTHDTLELIGPHAPAQHPGSLSPRALAQLPAPLRTAAAGSSERAWTPSPQPSSSLACGKANMCVSECGSARARVAGDPRGPWPRRLRAEDRSSLRALRCRASSVLGVRSLTWPAGAQKSAWPPRFTALEKPESWGALLPRSPQRIEEGRDTHPTNLGLVLSQRDTTQQPPLNPRMFGAPALLQPPTLEAGRGRPPQSLGGDASAATLFWSARRQRTRPT